MVYLHNISDTQKIAWIVSQDGLDLFEKLTPCIGRDDKARSAAPECQTREMATGQSQTNHQAVRIQ